jgi:hypothetical protein
LRLSDFQKPETTTRNISAEALCDSNAKKILGGQVDWQKIRMRTCELARGSNNPFTVAARDIRHDELDRAIDRGAFAELDDEEEVPEVKSQPKSKSRTTSRRSYGADAQFVSQHLDPDELCVVAACKMRDRVFREQTANPNRTFWSGLYYFLRTQPEGTLVKNVENQACLSTLITKTFAAV